MQEVRCVLAVLSDRGGISVINVSKMTRIMACFLIHRIDFRLV
jgi:hypothetical protein